VECKNRMIPVTIGGNWNHLNITQIVSEQHARKARYVIKELHKTTTFGTAHILRKVLM